MRSVLRAIKVRSVERIKTSANDLVIECLFEKRRIRTNRHFSWRLLTLPYTGVTYLLIIIILATQ